MDLFLVALGSYHFGILLQAAFFQRWEWQLTAFTRLTILLVAAMVISAPLRGDLDEWAILALAGAGLGEVTFKFVRLLQLAGDSYRLVSEPGAPRRR